MNFDPWHDYRHAEPWDFCALIGRGLASLGYLPGVPEDDWELDHHWPVWATEIYFWGDTAGEGIGYIRALAEGPQGPRDVLDAAFRLGGSDAVIAILEPFLKRKHSPKLLIKYLEKLR